MSVGPIGPTDGAPARRLQVCAVIASLKTPRRSWQRRVCASAAWWARARTSKVIERVRAIIGARWDRTRAYGRERAIGARWARVTGMRENNGYAVRWARARVRVKARTCIEDVWARGRGQGRGRGHGR